MEVKAGLKRQYHAAFAMLRIAIERCPEDLWLEGEAPRQFWRIAYHATFYTDLYLRTSLRAFKAWEKHREYAADLWEDPKGVDDGAPYSKADLLGYLDAVDACVDRHVDKMDLDAPTCGFSWYKMPKFDHQLVNLRHIQGHVGQLSELLMARGIDVDWKGGSLPS